MYSHRHEFPQEFGSYAENDPSITLSCIHASAKTGPTCIRTKMNSPRILSCMYRGQKTSTQTFFVQSFSTTLRVMDVRAKNRGRWHQKVRFPAAPRVGRNFLTPGHPGVSVRSVRRKSGPKNLRLCCFFFPECIGFVPGGNLYWSSGWPLPERRECL